MMDITDMIYSSIEWDQIIRGLQAGRATLVIDKGWVHLYDHSKSEVYKEVISNNQDIRLSLIELIWDMNKHKMEK